MQIDYSKYQRQKEAILIWKNRGMRGTFAHIMGFGKTLEGAMCADLYLKEPNKIVIVITPSIIIKEQWIKSIPLYFEAGLIEDDFIAINELIILTAHEVIDGKILQHCGLLIIDEIHKFTGDVRRGILEGEYIKYDHNLGLTGTMPSNGDRKKIEQYFPVIDTISEVEALSKDWISQFVEYNIGVDFTDEDKDKYEKFTAIMYDIITQFKGTVKLFKNGADSLFNSDLDVLISCFRGKYKDGTMIDSDIIRQSLARKKGWNRELNLDFDYNKALEDYWNPNNIRETAKTYVDIMDKRSYLMAFNLVKLKMVVEIFDKFRDTTICFNENTEFANRVEAQINYHFPYDKAVCYHSNMASRPLVNPETGDYFKYGKSAAKAGEIKIFGKTRLREDAVEGVREGRYKFLSTARALDEGLDLPQLRQVITTSGSANPLQYKQRSARGKRVDIYDKDKVTRIINVYFNDFYSKTVVDRDGLPKLVRSRDKTKLELRQSDSSSVVNWIENLSEI